MNHRNTLFAAAVLGLTGVGMGAFGAHALREWLTERGMTSAWETGARYQLVHAVALVALAGWMRGAAGVAQTRASRAAAAWCVGTVIFSGSLYGLAAGGPRWLGMVTPLGGVALLLGWAMVAHAAISKES
jgi:uncharacterized membrane protein YgdD (TMEM256/DUF423 family)